MNKNPYLNLLQTIWKFAAGMRGKLIFIYILFILSNLVRMIEPLILGKFLNVIQKGGPDVLRTSTILLGFYAFLNLINWSFHGPARCIERDLSFKIYKNFKEKMFQIITALPLKWHKNNHSGKTIDKVEKSSRALKNFTDEIYVYFESIIPFIFSFIAIILIMKWSSVFLIFFGFAVILAIFNFDKILIATMKKQNKLGHQVSSTFYDYISNITTVITLRLEKMAQKEFVQKILNVFPVYKKHIVANEIKWFTVSMTMTSAQFTIILFYVHQTFSVNSTIMIGNLMMLYSYMDKFIDVFFGMAWKYEHLVMCSTDILTVNNIYEAEKKFSEKTKIKKIKKWEKIKIKNCFFKYKDEKNEIHTLEKINLNLTKNKKIALIGESGSGKSTLMILLRGLDVANKIEIEVDEKKFSDSRIFSEITTLIPQDPEIFENTIKYNITLGIESRKSEIEKAIKLAAFEKVVAKLPKKIDTNIREKGVNFSGGEKQRLALARGIFAAKKSSIILLDEPTSSVDAKNEQQIYKNLLENFRDRCIISSIHKLHLLPLFDEIYFLEKGKILERGSFQNLISKNGHFQKMWKNYQKNLAEKN